MTVEVVTFGCRLNAYESQIIRRQAAEAGLGDAVIVNTCAVTAEAVRQAGQAIRRARREHPMAELIVTGCAAQLEPGRFATMPEVDRVVGNLEKLRAESFRPKNLGTMGKAVLVDDIMQASEVAGHLIEGFDGRARAFVEVQQGCDHRCTFCIIPFARGPNRSAPAALVLERVRRLVENGYLEVVLTGVDIASWGSDLPERPRLGHLVGGLLAEVPELPRLRLSSIDPAAIDGTLKRLFAEEARLMPHLHLSLQAGDDLVLKRMKRRHGRAEAIALCRELRERRPEMVFGADLIAGFPTEDEAMFRRSLDLVDDCELTHLHVFAYSERQGTPAARMPAVPKAVRRERARRLREKGQAVLARHLASRVGGRDRVLLEAPGRGRSETYLPVELDGPGTPGGVIPVEITAATVDRLLARPLS
jgi:threonylcarbamoyladenosine tRNA methylthiotransferase MtaB